MIQKIIFHLKSEWYKYFIEMVVVIFGILIAFNLEQWGAERDNKKKEIEMLKEFKRGLSADLAEMRGFIRFHEYSIQASRVILDVIGKDLPYHDSLDAFFSYTHAFSSFSGRMGPVEQLKNTNLAIVSNDTLRLDIISMYDEVYPRIRMVEQVVKRDYEQLRDFDMLYFDSYDPKGVSKNKTIRAPFWGVMHPIRFSDLKKQPEYAALLRAKISTQLGLLTTQYKPAEKRLSNLLKAIALEIERLE
ncbi:MAG: hypothetical protein JSU09_14340 [Bacteroidetes bacterium]|nr:hypothetical protein [Bacteroidota bacterium]